MTVRWHLKHAQHGNKPWAVQAEAMRRSDGHAKYGMFLECGLGKTSLDLNCFVDQDAADINLVVCPNSFRLDWKLAPAEWGVPFVRTGMWPNDPVPYDAECALYAVNYEAVRYDAHKPNNGFRQLMQLMERRRVRLTIDESKAIGNPSSDTTRGVSLLAQKAVAVSELNGTPMTESPLDYYSQLRVLGQFRGMTSRSFRNRYCKTGGFMGRQIVGFREDTQPELAKILDSCSFRALKADWRKDLPPQVQVPVRLEMTERQAAHYRTMLEEFYVELQDADEITVDLVLTQQEKLRQISSCLIKKDDKTQCLEDPKNNPKLRALLDLIDTGPTKMIVVHTYRESGTLLLEQLTKHKYGPAYIRGSMQPEELKHQKDKFNSDPGCRVIVCQQVAAARGHTLLGGQGNDRCNRMTFYENHFGLYWREQMKDRNHRGEQDQECTLYDLLTSPMDSLIVERLTGKKSKAELMDALVAEIRRRR